MWAQNNYLETAEDFLKVNTKQSLINKDHQLGKKFQQLYTPLFCIGIDMISSPVCLSVWSV